MGGSRRSCRLDDLLEGFPLEWDGQWVTVRLLT